MAYVEWERRSNAEHPVRDDGDYRTSAPVEAWPFDDDDLIAALHIYDQRPL